MKPSKLTALCLSLVLASAAAASADDVPRQRYQRRSGEMPISDPVLDPFSKGRVAVPPPAADAPRVPDSVDHSALDPEATMDETERETYEKYLIEQGFKDDPYDHLGQDRWDGTSGPETDAVDDGGYSDPVEW